MQLYFLNRLLLPTHGMKDCCSTWQPLSPMRQGQNIMSFREEAKQVYTSKLHSGHLILIFSAIRDGEEAMRLMVKILSLPEEWVMNLLRGCRATIQNTLRRWPLQNITRYTLVLNH